MFRLVLLLISMLALAGPAAAQRFALFEPQDAEAVPGVAAALAKEISAKRRLIDPDMAAAAFRTVEVADHFNMNVSEAKQIGAVVGCDRFVLIKTRIQRRAAAVRPEHFEAYAAVYIVDSRSGLLVDWRLHSFEANTAARAAAVLNEAAALIAADIEKKLAAPISNVSFPEFPEPPPESPTIAAAGLKLPIPYKRIKPQYTPEANLYGVKATIDIEAEIDADGTVRTTRVLRWAGYGLDRSVERAVRTMNWRSAMLDGKPLPMRVLLRYNFTKIEKDEEP